MAKRAPTLAQQKKMLETENAELKQRLEESQAVAAKAMEVAEDAQAAAENANAELEGSVVHTSKSAHAPRPVHEQAMQEPRLLYDPFDSKNPHKIVRNPSGYVLGWKNPMYRENHRGWRGWVPVDYDSEVGRDLKRYLLDPPRKMAHQDDNLVRRGDAILCMLPIDMWEARQCDRVERASRNREVHARDLLADNATAKDAKRGPVQHHAPNSVGGRTMTS